MIADGLLLINRRSVYPRCGVAKYHSPKKESLTMRGCIFRSPDDIYVEGRPGNVAGAQLIMIDGHVLCSDRLRIDAIEQGHRATGKDA